MTDIPFRVSSLQWDLILSVAMASERIWALSMRGMRRWKGPKGWAMPRAGASRQQQRDADSDVWENP